jgi:hypothetical protein
MFEIRFNKGGDDCISLDCVVKDCIETFDHHITHNKFGSNLQLLLSPLVKADLSPPQDQLKQEICIDNIHNKGKENLIKAVTINHTDTDSILSVVMAIYPEYRNQLIEQVMLSASLWCDVLNDNVTKQVYNGLLVHLSIRQKIGSAYRKYKIERYQAPPETKEKIMFHVLGYAKSLIRNLHNTLLYDPNYTIEDTYLLKHLDKDSKMIKQEIFIRNDLYSMITRKQYMDPLAVYMAATTPIVIMHPDESKYVIGLNPKYNLDWDLTLLANELNKIEINVDHTYQKSMWGGRQNVVGSPRRKSGSRLDYQQILPIISKLYGDKKV